MYQCINVRLGFHIRTSKQESDFTSRPITDFQGSDVTSRPITKVLVLQMDQLLSFWSYKWTNY